MEKLLVDICKIQYGYPFDSDKFSSKNGMPVIRIRDVVRGYSETFTTEEYDKDFVVSNGDMLIGMDGEFNIGKWHGEISLLNQRVCRLFPTDEIDADYLFYFMPQALKKIEDATPFATVKHLSAKQLNNIVVPLPPMEKQVIIAKTFMLLDDLITNTKEQLKKLDELVKSRFCEMFGDGQYVTVKASEVCDFITKGTTPQTEEITETYEDGLIPYIKVYNLSFTGELLFNDSPQYIPLETHRGKLARSQVFPNDVLMNIVGPPLGKFSLVTDEFDEWNINQAIAIFRVKDRVLPRYLMEALMQPEVLRPFLEQAVGIRQLNLSLEQCRNLELALPPLGKQSAFVEFAKQTDKSKFEVKGFINKLETLKKALMQKYFG